MHFNTIQAIEERERFLEQFNRMNEKIRSLTEKEQRKFESNHPEIIYYEEPFFTVFDSVNQKYSLKFRLINNGERTAENIKITPMLFIASGNEIISHTNVGKLLGATNPTTKITSYSKSTLYTEAFYDGIGLPDNEKIENFKYAIFLAINIQYSDHFTGVKYSNTEYFGWYSFTKNQYRFIKCSIDGFNIIESYIRKKNIKL